MVLTTVVYARLGEIAFGTSPGYAELMVTFRAFSDKDMELLIKKSSKKIQEITSKDKIDYNIQFVEEFSSTENSVECYEKLISIATEYNYSRHILDSPFKWSEDFGHFTKNIPGALIGIGSGINQPNLHNSKFNFPDKIIPVASQFLFSIYKNVVE